MTENKNTTPVRDMSLNDYISKILNHKDLKEIQNIAYSPSAFYSYYTDSEKTNTFYKNIQEGNMDQNNTYISEIYNNIDTKKFLVFLNKANKSIKKESENSKISEVFLAFMQVDLYLHKKQHKKSSQVLQNISFAPIQNEVKIFFQAYYTVIKVFLSYYDKKYEESKKILQEEEFYGFFKEGRKYLIGLCEYRMSNFGEAKKLLNESLQLLTSQKVPDEDSIANRKYWIGLCEYKMSNFGEAKKLFNECLQFLISQEVPNESSIGDRIYWIAMCEKKVNN